MRILVAPDSFKGSLSSLQAAKAICDGIYTVWPEAEVITLPMADGGEGTTDVIIDNLGGKIHTVQVQGPLGHPVKAKFGILPDGTTGIMDMASASGLTLISPAERNPLLTSTFGTGELIRAILDQGCTRIIIGIGGSATNDGGVGMAQALGVSFLDHTGSPVKAGGGYLHRIARIDMEKLDSRIREVEILIACDVNNPLLGNQGASYVYGPQKGANDETVAELESNMLHLSRVISHDLDIEVAQTPGAGAAGGLGAGLMVFAGGRFVSGVEIIMELLQLDHWLEESNYVCTGEGRLDLQTFHGKVVAGIVSKARQKSIPTIIFTGEIQGEDRWDTQDRVFPFCIAEGPTALEDMIRSASSLLLRATIRVFRIVDEVTRRVKPDD